MQLADVADAAVEEKVDGATALVMDKDDWKELGAGGDRSEGVKNCRQLGQACVIDNLCD